jgi:hypothetical protein
VDPLAGSSGSGFFEEFCCRGCGGQEAYRSRPRNFFEKYLLPVLLLQSVRCDHCYRRTYVLRTVAVLERPQPPRKPPQSQPSVTSESDGRVASGDHRGYTDAV